MKKHFLEFYDMNGAKVILDIDAIIALQESKSRADATEIYCMNCPNCFTVNKNIEFIFKRVTELLDAANYKFE